MCYMKPIFVRKLTEDERSALQAGLRSSDSFTLRRCQILLACARKQTATAIGRTLGCGGNPCRW